MSADGASKLLGMATGAQAAMTGIGMVAGFFQARSARRKERRRKRREKAFAIKSQAALTGETGNIRAEWAQKASFAREGLETDRGSLMNQWQTASQRAIGETGRSNLSYGGGAEMASRSIEKDFMGKNKGMELDYRRQFFNIQQGAESQLRDVQAGLLDLERVAMERGYKLPTQTVDTSANLGGYQ